MIRKRRTFWPNQIWRWPRPILEENPNCEAITTFEPGMEPITRFIFLQPMIFNMCSEEIFGKIKSSLRKYYSICIIYQIQTNSSLILVQQVLQVAQNSIERYRLFKRQVLTSIHAREIFELSSTCAARVIGSIKTDNLQNFNLFVLYMNLKMVFFSIWSIKYQKWPRTRLKEKGF